MFVLAFNIWRELPVEEPPAEEPPTAPSAEKSRPAEPSEKPEGKPQPQTPRLPQGGPRGGTDENRPPPRDPRVGYRGTGSLRHRPRTAPGAQMSSENQPHTREPLAAAGRGRGTVREGPQTVERYAGALSEHEVRRNLRTSSALPGALKTDKGRMRETRWFRGLLY
jgi:hypothetical protein